MTGFTILISAKNLVGKAVDAVKSKLEQLNEGVRKWRHLVMGASVVFTGLARGFKNLIDASTKTDQLEAAFSSAAQKWQELKSVIGDGLVDIVSKIAGPVEWVVDKMQALVDGLQTVAGAAGYLFGSLWEGNDSASFKDLLKDSWDAGKEVVADARAEAEERRRRPEEEAAARKAASDKEDLRKKLEVARGKHDENVWQDAFGKADDEGKLRMLDEKVNRLEGEHDARNAGIHGEAGLDEEAKRLKFETEELDYLEKMRDVQNEREKIEARMAEAAERQKENAQNEEREKRKEALEREKEQAEEAWGKLLEKYDAKIKALREGIASDTAAAEAGDAAAARHRRAAEDVKAVRREESAAAREERRWQNRLGRAEALAARRGEDKLPRWAREALASEGARKAADQARIDADKKGDALAKTEEARTKLLNNMKTALDQIKDDLKEALSPAS